MKKSYLICLVLLTLGCNKSISEADKKRAIELNNKAVEYQMIDKDLEKAKEYFAKALAIDAANFPIRGQLISVYIQQDSIDKAFQVLEKTPAEEKETLNFYYVKGNLYDFKKQMDKAVESYSKALALADLPSTIKNEMDLGTLVNYAMLETLAGKKQQAVNRLNKALEQDWLTQANKEYLETFRNEFEFYQGNGAGSFDSGDDLMLKTTNADSLEIFLKNNHINTSGGLSSDGNDTAKIYVDEKYKEAIHKLGIKTYPVDNNF